MKRSTLELLCCPSCQAELSLRDERGEGTVDEGGLFCSHCELLIHSFSQPMVLSLILGLLKTFWILFLYMRKSSRNAGRIVSSK